MSREIWGNTVGTPIKPEKVVEMGGGCVTEEERNSWNGKADKEYVDDLFKSITDFEEVAF